MTQLTRLRPPPAHTRPGPARVDNAADVARVMAHVDPFAYPTAVKIDDRTMTVHIMRPAKKADAVQLADSIGAHVHIVHEEEAPFLHYWVGHTDTLEVRVCWIGDDE